MTAWSSDNNFGLTNVPSGLNSVIAVAGGGYRSLALMAVSGAERRVRIPLPGNNTRGDGFGRGENGDWELTFN